MRKITAILASLFVATFFASSASAATAYETEVTKGVNFRAKPSTSGYKYRMIHRGEDIHVIQKVNRYWMKVEVKDGTIGYISARPEYTEYRGAASAAPATPAKPAASTSVRDNIVATATGYNGHFDYKWGSEPWTTNYRYTDCSAYTELVFRQNGIDLKRSSRDQAKQGTYVSKSNLSKGDLVFFDTNSDGVINHVGIYIGGGDFIHATPSLDGVGISNLNSGFWSSHYVTARSVI